MSSMWVLRRLAKRWLGDGSRRPKAPRRARRPRSARPAVEHLECRLTPAVDNWTGMGMPVAGVYNWNDPGNWSHGVPNPGDDLVFPGNVPAASLTNSNNLTAGTVFNSISFSGSGYNLKGNSVVLNGTASTGVVIVNNPSGSSDTVGFNIQLGATAGNLQFFSIGTLGASLTINGSLSSPAGQAGATLAKDGTGTLVLGADDSGFNGPITVQSGVLQVKNAKALGTGTTTVLFDTNQPQNSGQLQLSGGIGPVANNLILNGSGPDGNGALFNADSTNTISGNIELDSDTAIGAFASSTNTNGVLNVQSTALVLNGQISDTGNGHNLSKEGLGQVVLDPLGHANGNVYRGNTVVDNGVLTVRHSLALGQGPGGGAPATATVNSGPNQSGTLQTEYVANANRLDPNVLTDGSGNVVGFNVPNELLVLNGPGFEGIHVYPRIDTGSPATINTTSGAFNNKAGNNAWAQNVTLWSGASALSFDPIFWNYPTVGLGAEKGTSITFNGQVSDNTGGNRNYSLIKTHHGRVIFTDANTFSGKAEVLDGFLNIRDSGGLGSALNQAFVFPGASLELQADAKTDSVTGTTDLSVSNIELTLLGHGADNLGALHNINGTNQWNGKIHLQSLIQRANPAITFTSDGAAIGVDADPGDTINGVSGRFDANANALTPLGLSQLTVNSPIDGPASAEFFKVGQPHVATSSDGTPLGTDSGGELVLTANNPYLGVTDIQAGWITLKNNQALGGLIPGITDIRQPGTIVDKGASLVLKRDLSGNNLNVYENLLISGDGITHRLGANGNFSWLNQKGALLNLEGDNTVGGVDTDPTSPLFHSEAGDIALNGQAGIGAELDGFPANSPPFSQLTLMGKTTEVKPFWADPTMTPEPGSGIDKLGSQRVLLQGPGTYTGPVNVEAGVLRVQNDTALGNGSSTTTVTAGAALELKESVPIETGGLSSGIQVLSETLVLNGTGNSTAPSALPNNFPTPALENFSGDNLWRGPVTFASDTTIDVEQESRLTFYGNIGDTGATGAGFTKVGFEPPPLSPAKPVGTGELVLAGNNSYHGMTQVNAGTLNLQSGTALGAPSTPTVQTVTVTGTSGTFTLGFTDSKGVTDTTPSLPFNDTAQDVQAQLNMLPNLSGEGGVASVSLSSVNPSTNVYTISFGGNLSGFNQALLTATPSGGASTAVATLTPGDGGVVTSGSAGIDLQGNITVAGKSLQTLNTGSTHALNITPVATWFPQGPATINNGQTPGNQPVAGRIDGVSVDPNDPNVIYVSAAGGGAWKTTDGGKTWQPLDDYPLTQGEVTPTGSGSDTVSGLLHWWQAEGDATDSAMPPPAGAGGDNGVLTGVGGFGDVGFTNGERGQGFQFLGDDSFVQFGPENFGTADFSVGFFVSTTQKAYQTILGTRETDTSTADGNFFGARMTAAGKVEVTFDSFDNFTSQFQPLQVTSQKSINDGAFHYVTITRGPGSGGLSTVSLYIDGALDNSGSLSSPTDLNNGNPLNVGWEPADDSSAAPLVTSFTGVIDEIQVYNRALSTAEVKQLDLSPTMPNAAQNLFGGPIVVAPTNPDVIYATTGDANNGPDSFYGQGIYMSRDGGRTWALLQGNKGTNEFAGATIAKLVVDPVNPFTVYAAVNDNGVNSTAAGNNGIWYCSNTSVANPVWLNLTQYESQKRASQNPPLPPGPDDGTTTNFTTTAQYTDVSVVVDTAPDALPNSRFIVMAIGNPDGGYADFNNGGFGANGAYTAHLELTTPDPTVPSYPSFSSPDWTPTGWDVTNFPLLENAHFSTTGSSLTNGPLPGTGQAGTVIGIAHNGVVKTAAGPNFSGSQGDGATFSFYAPVTYPTAYTVPYIDGLTEGFADPGGNDLKKGTFREVRKATITWHANTGLWDTPNWGTTSAAPGSDYQGTPGNGQGQFTSTVLVDPNNQLRVFVAGVGQPFTSGPWMSLDGGKNWTDLALNVSPAPHVNYHGMALDNQGRLLVSTDGGVWRLDNTSPIQWNDLNGNLAVTQFNSVAQDPNDPFHAWGGSEGNGLAVYNGDGGNLAWAETDGGNGGPVVVDIKNPLNVYHIQDGVLRKSTDGGKTWQTVFTVQSMPSANPTYYPYLYYYPIFAGAFFNTQQPSDLSTNPGYNAQANEVSNNIQVPLVIDNTNTARLVIAGPPAGTPQATYGSQPWESVQGGTIGSFVSLDPNNQIQSKNPTPQLKTAILGIALAQNQGPFQADPRFPLVTDQGSDTYVPNTIYVLTNNGVYVTKDHGVDWVLSNTGLTANDLASITVDPSNRDIAYVVRDGATGSGPHVFRTTDAGQHWTALDGAPLPDVPTWAVTIDPKNGQLFVGNDDGVWATANPAAATPTWQRFGVGMPHTQVKQIVLDPNLDRLTAGTYGRSMFELFLDDSRANGGAIRAVSGSSVWTGPVTLTGNITVRTEKDATVNFLGPISNDSAADNFIFTKVGPGTVVLSGMNSYGGAGSSLTVNGQLTDTDVQQGVLVVHNPLALGSPASGTVVHAGAALELQSDVQQEPLQLNGDGIAFSGHNTGALRNVSNNNTYTGPITLNTNSTIGVDSGSQLTVGSKPGLLGTGSIGDGSPSNNFSLTKELTGTLVLASADTYGGKTEVIQGALQVQNAQALGASGTAANGTDVFDGAQLQLQTPTTGPLATQPVVVSGEVLTLSGTGINNTGALVSTGGTNTWQGPITLVAQPNYQPESSPAGVVAFGASDPTATLVVDPTSPSTGLQEQEPTGLSKVGPGTVVLQTANNYSGTTYVNAGILRIQDPHSLGTPNTLEIQRVTVGGDKNGSFTLTFNGQTTDQKNHPLPFGTTALQVQNALDALPNVGNGNATVTLNTATLPDGNTVYVYTVEFIGTLAGINEPLMTATGLNGTTAMASAVADGSIGTQVLSGATLQLDLDPGNAGLSPTVSGETLDLNGVGVARPTPITAGALQDTNLGALDNISGNNTWSANVTLDTTTPSLTPPQTDAVGVDGGSLTLGGDVTDPPVAPFTPATLEKVGTGSLFFPSVNDYRGNTQVIDGILSVAAGTNGAGNSALGTPIGSETEQLTVLGGTGSYTLTFQGKTTDPANPLPFNATAQQIHDALTALPTIGMAGGTVNVVQTQTGNPNVYTITFGGTLAGQNLDPANGTAITANPSGGAATMVVTTVQGGLGGTSVSGAGTLQMDGDIVISGEPLSLSGNGAAGGANGLTLGALDSAPSSGNTWDDTVTLNGPASVGAETLGTLTIDQPIVESQTGSTLTKFGFGTVAFTGAANNTYTGTTFVDDGVLDLNKSGGGTAIAGNLVVGDGTFGQPSPDTLRLEAGNEIAGSASVTVNGDGLLDLNDQSQTLAGLTVTDGTVTTGAGTHGGQDGHLTLSGPLNMTGGTLSIGRPNATVTLAGSGTGPDVIATSDNATGNAAIIGQGTLALGAAPRVFRVNAGFDALDLQVAAPIGGSVGLTKTGNGVMELTGANTYSGTTTVSQGELFVDGAGKIAAASLNGGLLGGTGTVGGITATANGGTLAPGTPGGTLGAVNPGILNVTGNVTLDSATTFQVELNGTTPGSQYSQLDVQGNVNLGNATVTGTIPTGSFVPNVGQMFTVIQVSGGGNAVTPGFGTMTEFIGGIKFSNIYNPTTVVLERIKANVNAVLGAGTTPGVQYVAGASPSQAQVVFTATVTPEAGATFPAGGVSGEMVQFFDQRNSPATLLGTGTINSSGVATLTLPVSGSGSLDALAGVGLHMVTVHFAGDSNFNAGDSSPTVNFGGLAVQGVTPNKAQAVLSAQGGLTSAVITFTQPAASLPLAQLALTDPNGKTVSLAGATLTPNAAKTVWTLSGFAAQTTAGVYKLTVGPNVPDGSGFPMDQNGNGLYGETPADQFVDPIVVDGLAVTGVTPVGPVLDSTGLSSVAITFNMAVDASNNGVGTEGFGPNSLTLTGPGGAIPLIDGSGHLVAGVTLTPDATDKVWTVTFPKQTNLGTYTLTVGPDVYDRAGDQMNQNFNKAPNGNTTFGEPGFAPAGDEFKGTILVTGLEVTSLAPAHPVLDGPGLSSATITFNEAVSTTPAAGHTLGFGPSSLTLTDPNGNVTQLIDGSGNLAAGVTLAPDATGKVWTVTFPAQHTLGDYFLSVGANVLDAEGNLMDQNQNGAGGETGVSPAGDQFTGGLVVDGLAVSGLAPAQAVANGPGLSSVTITFNEPVSTTPTAGRTLGFGPTSLKLTDPKNTVTNLIDASGNLAAGVTLTPDATGKVWTVTFATQHTPGTYTLTVGPEVFDRAGFAMNQNGNTTAGEPGDAFTGTLKVAGLEVVSLGAPTTVLDGTGLSSATIVFNEPVNSFPVSDVTLTGPKGSVALTGATLMPVPNSSGVTDDTTWRLTFSSQTALGNYTLRVGPNVTDANGFLLDQNQNGAPGEASDVFTGTLTVAGLQVVSASPTGIVPSDPGLSSFTVTFNEAVGAGGLNGQVEVSGPNGDVGALTVTDQTLGNSNAHNVWQVSFANQSAVGTYTLTVQSGVKDAVGNLLGSQFNAQVNIVPTPFVGVITAQQANVLAGPITPVFRRVHGHMVRVKGHFTQTVTLFNTGQGPIQGPFALVLIGLPVKRVHHHVVRTVHVLNAAGFGSVLFPGAPFVADLVSAQQLGSFQGATFVINLQSDTGAVPAYTPVILAGLVP